MTPTEIEAERQARDAHAAAEYRARLDANRRWAFTALLRASAELDDEINNPAPVTALNGERA